MAVMLAFCVQMVCKLQTGAIIIILLVDVSKRVPSCMNLCVLIQKLNFQVGAGGHLGFVPPMKKAGILGRDLGLFLLTKGS